MVWTKLERRILATDLHKYANKMLENDYFIDLELGKR